MRRSLPLSFRSRTHAVPSSRGPPRTHHGLALVLCVVVSARVRRFRRSLPQREGRRQPDVAADRGIRPRLLHVAAWRAQMQVDQLSLTSLDRASGGQKCNCLQTLARHLRADGVADAGGSSPPASRRRVFGLPMSLRRRAARRSAHQVRAGTSGPRQDRFRATARNDQ